MPEQCNDACRGRNCAQKFGRCIGRESDLVLEYRLRRHGLILPTSGMRMMAAARRLGTGMKLGIINSAFEQAGVDTTTGLEHIARIGFDCVDLFVEALTLENSEKRVIQAACERLHLSVASLPVVAVGLIDPSEPVRAFHTDRVKSFIDLGAEFGAHNILLVLGEYIWQREVIAPAEQWQWALERCRSLGDYAGEKGISIALELEPFHMSLLNSTGEMARFLRDCAHPHVKANIDISHLVLAGCPPESLAQLKGEAIHVHISDCDGKVHGDLPPGRGVVAFPPYLQAIKALEMQGALSIELEFAPDPARIVEWVEEAYTSTDRLMRDAGLRG